MALNLMPEWSVKIVGYREGVGVKVSGRTESNGRSVGFAMLAESAQQLADALHDTLDTIETEQVRRAPHGEQ